MSDQLGKTPEIDHEEQERLMAFLMKRRADGFRLRTRAKIRVWQITIRGAKVLKRAFDLLGSVVLLIVLSPLLIATAVWLKLDSPGPLIYCQVRVGFNGIHFHFYKFRSMYVDADRRKAELEKLNESKDGVIFKMKRDPRVTRCGSFIRKYSIDELPQIVNVLLGDMGLVGPRPPLPSEVAHYTLDDRKRLQVIPGITGLWQVSGRSDIPFKQQVALDKEYIKSNSIWKDLWILLKTIPAVFTGRGAY